MVPPPNSESELSSKSSNSSPSDPSESAHSTYIAQKLEVFVITLFPELFPTVLASSLLGKAEKKGLVSFHLIQLRNFAQDKHKSVDDSPFGGGEGMLLKADVLFDALQSIQAVPGTSQRTILLSPQGKPFLQTKARELSKLNRLIFICGHYEGVDQRFINQCVDEEISIGDYVLTGGELPALVIIDSVVRLLPGTVGNERSISEETFENGLLKYPQYTRPREFLGVPVPEVLLEGNHSKIAKWRQTEMEKRTADKRPDLWDSYLKTQKLP